MNAVALNEETETQELQTKVCIRCGEEKPLELFAAHWRAPVGGHARICKSCDGRRRKLKEGQATEESGVGAWEALRARPAPEQCMEGRHHRYCNSDDLVAARWPDFFEHAQHPPSALGQEWQVCVLCGDAHLATFKIVGESNFTVPISVRAAERRLAHDVVSGLRRLPAVVTPAAPAPPVDDIAPGTVPSAAPAPPARPETGAGEEQIEEIEEEEWEIVLSRSEALERREAMQATGAEQEELAGLRLELQRAREEAGLLARALARSEAKLRLIAIGREIESLEMEQSELCDEYGIDLAEVLFTR